MRDTLAELRCETAGCSRGQHLKKQELQQALASLRALSAGTASASAGEDVLLDLSRRPPPSVSLLRDTKVGVAVRRLKTHSHSTIAALASSL